MASPPLESRVLELGRHRVLLVKNRGYRLEPDAEFNRHTVADASLDATAPIGRSRHVLGLIGAVGIIVLAPQHEGAMQSTADFKRFARGKAQHGLGEIGFKLIEHRLSPARRDASNHTSNGAANAISRFADFLDTGDHCLGDGGIGATDDVRFDLFPRDQTRIHMSLDRLNPIHPRHDLHPKLFAQNLLRNRACGNSSDGFASAGSTSAGPSPNAVLGVIGKVGMGRTVLVLHLVVVPAPSILIPHQQGDWSAEGQAIDDAAQDFNPVALLPLRHDSALPGSAAIQFQLDFLFCDRQARRAAIDHHPDAHSVRFAKSGYAEDRAELAGHEFNYGGSAASAHGKRLESHGDKRVKDWAQLTDAGVSSCTCGKPRELFHIATRADDDVILGQAEPRDDSIADAVAVAMIGSGGSNRGDGEIGLGVEFIAPKPRGREELVPKLIAHDLEESAIEHNNPRRPPSKTRDRAPLICLGVVTGDQNFASQNVFLGAELDLGEGFRRAVAATEDTEGIGGKKSPVAIEIEHRGGVRVEVFDLPGVRSVGGRDKRDPELLEPGFIGFGLSEQLRALGVPPHGDTGFKLVLLDEGLFAEPQELFLRPTKDIVSGEDTRDRFCPDAGAKAEGQREGLAGDDGFSPSYP